MKLKGSLVLLVLLDSKDNHGSLLRIVGCNMTEHQSHLNGAQVRLNRHPKFSTVFGHILENAWGHQKSPDWMLYLQREKGEY